MDLTSAIGTLDHSLTPVVNIATGLCFGYQARLCHVEQAGFVSPRQVFDACAAAGWIVPGQVQIWERALAKFASLAPGFGSRLFLELDARALDGSDGLPNHLRRLLAQYNVPESAVALVLGDLPVPDMADPRLLIRPLKRLGCKIAIGHFGGLLAAAHLLYAAEPDFVIIDPFFVRNLATDTRKKLLFSQMVSLAHLLGVVVVASGVESERELLTCKEIGCDLAQGPLIGLPKVDPAQLPETYPAMELLARKDRRAKDSDHRMILDRMEAVPPLQVDAELTELFDRLRRDTRQTFVPIVDHLGQPLGLIREAEVKNYAYTPFGMDLISNKGLGRKLKDFIVRCPIADVHLPVASIISIYSADEDAEGIILVQEMRYVGFLSARAIIGVINEKSLAQARDQNPLSKLPGNALINHFVTESLGETDSSFVYAYVDFDNFKPFNDKYGFRQGDRAILLFTELMRKDLPLDQHFLGHIGGDDFFIGFKGQTLDQARPVVATLLEAFRSQAESFYDAEAIARGHIQAADRDGNLKVFPLLSASAVLVEAPPARPVLTVDDISAAIADLKKQAKHSPDKLAWVCMGGACEG